MTEPERKRLIAALRSPMNFPGSVKVFGEFMAPCAVDIGGGMIGTSRQRESWTGLEIADALEELR